VCAATIVEREVAVATLVFGNEAKMRADGGNENAYLLYVLLNEIQE
jgi:hypothetical protein